MAEDRGARLATRVVHDGRVVHLAVDTVRFPDGSVGELELVRHRGAAAVLPVFETGEGAGPEDDGAEPDVLLLRQYRYAAGGVIYEVPAGIVEPGEGPEECARRELEEETGFRAARLVELTTIHTTPGFATERIRLYAAFGLTPGASSTGPTEFLEVERMPLSRAVDLIRRGEMTDAKSIVTILFAARFLLRPAGRGSVEHLRGSRGDPPAGAVAGRTV